MGLTKQKLARLKMLDKILSDRYHNYSTEDIAEKISCQMTELDPSSDGIGKRCIEKDIKYLREMWPEFVDIEEYSAVGVSKKTQKPYTKHCYRYADPSFSIFKKDMSDDEEYLLREALSILGQFEGLPNFEALEGLRLGLGARRTDKKIISFTKNPLEGTNVLGEIFTVISRKQVIELSYHTFGDPTNIRKVHLHPYLLKEYNRRWFLIASAEDTGKLLNFALDRIDGVEPLPSHKYMEYAGDINEFFEDIIGVTLYEDSPLYKIYFWVSDYSKDYVKTKPLHESQRNISGDMEQKFREKYPSLKGGRFFRIDCRDNYELIRELTSFGKDLVVISPSEIQNKVIARINGMAEQYSNL